MVMLAMLPAFDILIVVLLGCVLLLCLGIHGRVTRIESRMANLGRDETGGPVSSSSVARGDEAEGPYEQFLAEDPRRLAMSKSEQFAAYREWRKERGLNWSDPSS